MKGWIELRDREPKYMESLMKQMDDQGCLSGCKVEYLTYNFFTVAQMKNFHNLNIQHTHINEQATKMGFAIYIKQELYDPTLKKIDFKEELRFDNYQSESEESLDEEDKLRKLSQIPDGVRVDPKGILE